MNKRPSPSVRIGDLSFDLEGRRLVGRGVPAALSPKEFQLLELLVGRRPAAVSKEEIHAVLWPDVVVTEASLTSLVNGVRARLGQSGRGGPLRTVHGFGYALAAGDDAPPGDPPARLVRAGGAEIPVFVGETLLGREPGTAGSIDDASVSRRHARLVFEEGRATVEDLGSKNGTFVNGRRLGEPSPLEDGDEIRLGLVSLVFRAVTPLWSTTRTIG